MIGRQLEERLDAYLSTGTEKNVKKIEKKTPLLNPLSKFFFYDVSATFRRRLVFQKPDLKKVFDTALPAL